MSKIHPRESDEPHSCSLPKPDNKANAFPECGPFVDHFLPHGDFGEQLAPDLESHGCHFLPPSCLSSSFSKPERETGTTEFIRGGLISPPPPPPPPYSICMHPSGGGGSHHPSPNSNHIHVDKAGNKNEIGCGLDIGKIDKREHEQNYPSSGFEPHSLDEMCAANRSQRSKRKKRKSKGGVQSSKRNHDGLSNNNNSNNNNQPTKAGRKEAPVTHHHHTNETHRPLPSPSANSNDNSHDTAGTALFIPKEEEIGHNGGVDPIYHQTSRERDDDDDEEERDEAEILPLKVDDSTATTLADAADERMIVAVDGGCCLSDEPSDKDEGSQKNEDGSGSGDDNNDSTPESPTPVYVSSDLFDWTSFEFHLDETRKRDEEMERQQRVFRSSSSSSTEDFFFEEEKEDLAPESLDCDSQGSTHAECDEDGSEGGEDSNTKEGEEKTEADNAPELDTAELEDEGEDRSRRRYRRSPRPNLSRPTIDIVADIHHQRQTIAAERARRREDINATFSRQQQLTPAHTHTALKILCNEAHQRHVAQLQAAAKMLAATNSVGVVATDQNELDELPLRGEESCGDNLKKGTSYTAAIVDLSTTWPAEKNDDYEKNLVDMAPSSSSSSVSAKKFRPPPPPLALRDEQGHARQPSSNTQRSEAAAALAVELKCAAAAWRNVADCVEESLFCPSAVQARLSCMGIFRNNMSASNLLCFDDHEEERFNIRVRQQQIINTIRCQAMTTKGNRFFLQRPFHFTASEGPEGVPRGFFSKEYLLAAEADEDAKKREEEQEQGEVENFETYSPTHFISMDDFF